MEDRRFPLLKVVCVWIQSGIQRSKASLRRNSLAAFLIASASALRSRVTAEAFGVMMGFVQRHGAVALGSVLVLSTVVATLLITRRRFGS